MLRCNFPTIKDDTNNLNWQTNYIVINDEGANYFQINFDIKKNKIFRLTIKGES